MTHHHRQGGQDPINAIPNLALYVRSDTGVSVSGSVVTGWADQSGNGRNLTPVASPTLAANIQNGKPGVLLNGTSQYFTYATSLLSGARPITAFLVFRSSNLATFPTVWNEWSSGAPFNADDELFVGSSGWFGIVSEDPVGNGNSAHTLAGSVVNGTTYVGMGASDSGLTVITSINGAADVTATGPTNTAWTPTDRALGAALHGGSPFAYFGGHLFAFAVYARYLTTTERSTARQYLRTQYAVY